MKKHCLKIQPKYMKHVELGVKSFELRKNDRDYQVGDILILQEWENGEYTGRAIEKEVIYMLADFHGVEKGYCILGLNNSFVKCIYDDTTICLGIECKYVTPGRCEEHVKWIKRIQRECRQSGGNN